MKQVEKILDVHVTLRSYNVKVQDEDNIKLNLTTRKCDIVCRILLAFYKVRSLLFVKALRKLRDP